MLDNVPTLREFVAGQLFDHADAYGHHATVRGLPSGEVLVDVEQVDGTYLTVYVDCDGTLHENDRHMRPVRLRGFCWHAEPTDTGKMHGPALPNGVQAADAGFGFSRYVGPWVTRSGFRVDFNGLNPRPAQAADLPRLMASGAVHSRLTARDFPTPREVVARALVGTSFMAGPTFDAEVCGGTGRHDGQSARCCDECCSEWAHGAAQAGFCALHS